MFSAIAVEVVQVRRHERCRDVMLPRPRAEALAVSLDDGEEALPCFRARLELSARWIHVDLFRSQSTEDIARAALMARGQ
jgi:hypothetical protein